MYLPKIDKYEKVCLLVDGNKDRVTRYNHCCPLNSRGQAYYVLATFQRDGYKKAELCEQSIKYYNQLMKEDFNEEMLQQYQQNNVKHMINFYVTIIDQNGENYNNLIGVKVDYIIKLPLNSDETKQRIKELNVLRRDFAVQLLIFEKFVQKNSQL